MANVIATGYCKFRYIERAVYDIQLPLQIFRDYLGDEIVDVQIFINRNTKSPSSCKITNHLDVVADQHLTQAEAERFLEYLEKGGYLHEYDKS